MGLMGEGSHSWFNRQRDTGWVDVAGGEFFQGLHIDERRNSFFGGGLVTALQRIAELLRSGDVLTTRAQPFRHLVIAQVFLEQVHMHGAYGSERRRKHSPAVVVVNHRDYGDLV